MSLAYSPISPRRWPGWKRAASICRSSCGIPFSHGIDAGTVSVSKPPGPHQGNSKLARAGSRRHASVRMGDDTIRAVDHTAQKALSGQCPTRRLRTLVDWPVSDNVFRPESRTGRQNILPALDCLLSNMTT